MATIQLTLKSRSRNDGTNAIVIRIRHNRQYFDILTNTAVPISKWDTKKGKVLGDKKLQLQKNQIHISGVAYFLSIQIGED